MPRIKVKKEAENESEINPKAEERSIQLVTFEQYIDAKINLLGTVIEDVRIKLDELLKLANMQGDN